MDKQETESNGAVLVRLANTLADNAELLRRCAQAFCSEHPDYEQAPMSAMLRQGATPEIIAAIAGLVQLASGPDDLQSFVMTGAMLYVASEMQAGIPMPEHARPTVHVPNSGRME